MGVALVVCPMVLRVCKKCTAKEIPTLDPSTGNCVAHTPPLHRCSSTLQQPCHCKTMQNCTLPGSRRDVQNSSKQLLSFHHFSSGLCPNSKSVLLLLFKLAKTKSSILLANSRSRKSIRYFSAK